MILFKGKASLSHYWMRQICNIIAVKLKITISKYDQFALLSVPVCFYDHKTELYYNLWVHTIFTKYKKTLHCFIQNTYCSELENLSITILYYKYCVSLLPIDT